jgi:hypothetical protein
LSSQLSQIHSLSLPQSLLTFNLTLTITMANKQVNRSTPSGIPSMSLGVASSQGERSNNGSRSTRSASTGRRAMTKQELVSIIDSALSLIDEDCFASVDTSSR